jgi:Putative F0F1-ATPase subunit Ca2+/Mg2+ transporter
MEPASTDPKKPKLYNNSYLKYAGLGLQMMGVIGFSAWLGTKLDQYLKLTFPAFLLSFVFLAFTAVMVQLYCSSNKE